jgi:hypothetical protein
METIHDHRILEEYPEALLPMLGALHYSRRLEVMGMPEEPEEGGNGTFEERATEQRQFGRATVRTTSVWLSRCSTSEPDDRREESWTF